MGTIDTYKAKLEKYFKASAGERISSKNLFDNINDLDELNKLLESKPDRDDRSYFHIGLTSRKNKFFKDLIEKTLKVLESEPNPNPNPSSVPLLNKALLAAAILGTKEQVKKFIAAGAEVNFIGEEGLAALHYAACRDYNVKANNAVMQYLINVEKVDLNILNKEGHTPLDFVRNKDFIALLRNNNALEGSEVAKASVEPNILVSIIDYFYDRGEYLHDHDWDNNELSKYISNSIDDDFDSKIQALNKRQYGDLMCMGARFGNNKLLNYQGGRLINQHPNINYRDKKSLSMLDYAIIYGNIELTEKLISHKDISFAPGSDHRAPLNWMFFGKGPNVLGSLLDKHKPDQENSPLKKLIYNTPKPECQYVLKQLSTATISLEHLALLKGLVEERLVQPDPAASKKKKVTKKKQASNPNGETDKLIALINSIYMGNVFSDTNAQFNNLIFHSKPPADLKALNDKQFGDLMCIAAFHNNYQLLYCDDGNLIENHRNINHRDNQGFSMLDYAITFGNIPLTEILINHKNISLAPDDKGIAPLEYLFVSPDKNVLISLMESHDQHPENSLLSKLIDGAGDLSREKCLVRVKKSDLSNEIKDKLTTLLGGDHISLADESYVKPPRASNKQSPAEEIRMPSPPQFSENTGYNPQYNSPLDQRHGPMKGYQTEEERDYWRNESKLDMKAMMAGLVLLLLLSLFMGPGVLIFGLMAGSVAFIGHKAYARHRAERPVRRNYDQDHHDPYQELSKQQQNTYDYAPQTDFQHAPNDHKRKVSGENYEKLRSRNIKNRGSERFL
jgi:ankyrin repeat protein